MSAWLPLLLVAASPAVIHADPFFSADSLLDAEVTGRGLNAIQGAAWETITAKACEGHQSEQGACLPQLDCNPCVPVDCSFGEWGEWSSASGFVDLDCTSLCQRTRKVGRNNSECGRPCKGDLKETQKCPDKDTCYHTSADCTLSPWSVWPPCDTSTAQSTRTRLVVADSKNGGTACGKDTPVVLSESLTCMVYKPKNCTLSQWTPWADCSETCGGGETSRARHIVHNADRLGFTCHGELDEVARCNAHPCPTIGDCVMGHWSAWSACKSSTPVEYSKIKEVNGQTTRSRSVKIPLVAHGVACDDEVIQTKGCIVKPAEKHEALLSQWTKWNACSKTSDGGQRYRARTILAEGSILGGKINLKETDNCNTQRGGNPAHDCKLFAWTPWSPCPVTCGEAIRNRSRSMLAARSGGIPCEPTNLEELQACHAPKCEKEDCTWSEWSKWTTCSKSCGAGMTNRSRHISSYPKHGGDCDAKLLAEGKPCNEEACPDKCVNGTWAAWSAWGSCSASCGKGYMTRTRIPATAPNECGFPTVGHESEYSHCAEMAAGCNQYPDLDCKLSAWAAWTDCSNTCAGHHTRQRVVLVYAHGKGKACSDDSLTELRTCSQSDAFACSGVQPPTDCQMTEWTRVSPCTVSCGGGSLMVSRTLLPPKNGGKPCKGPLSKVQQCNMQACPNNLCQDCKWGQWSAFDQCLSFDGQRTRRREVEQIGNYCGKRCEPTAATETTGCRDIVAGPAAEICSWTRWSSWSECPTNCGTHAISRTRELERTSNVHLLNHTYLVKEQVGSAMRCAGSQGDRGFCENPQCLKCHPRDCEFTTWGAWALPGHASALGTGLCHRTRDVKELNNECGKGCHGHIIETKKCQIASVPKDCIIGQWSPFSHCATDTAGQKERTRHIEDLPEFGGICDSAVKETHPCNPLWLPPRDCETSVWSKWSDCTATCRGGLQQRIRSVAREAIWPGKPCDGALQEMRECNTGSCTTHPKEDCSFQAWGPWSASCTGQNQRFRARGMTPALDGGAKCAGEMKETEACAKAVVDCEISPWTAWGPCDTTCNIGMRERHRQVHKYPESGGKECTKNKSHPVGSLVEVGTCNEHKLCSAQQNCEVNEWKEWTICTHSCGVGQQMRARSVAHLATDDGKGCQLHMSEARPCPAQPVCTTDCFWNEWSSWSVCSVECGGGHHVRSRGVTGATPGGKACAPKVEEEMKACGQSACNKSCTDGSWGEWSNWQPCSSTCKGGFTWQVRRIAQEASKCGKPAEGLSQNVKKCNENITCVTNADCKLADWTEWGACSATCAGVAERERSIATRPSGHGKQCVGALKAVRPCSGDEANSAACVDVKLPCKLGEWTSFSRCSVSCGSGQATRLRSVIRGGGECSAPLTEVKGCNEALCDKPVDCLWYDWSMWGSCNVCGGQRHRVRGMIRPGSHGGALCESAHAGEIETCPRTCHGTYLCTWASWSKWTDCSKSCGNSGRRSRARSLHLVNSTTSTIQALYGDDDVLEDKVKELYRKTQNHEAQRIQHLAIAFSTGLLSLVVAFLVAMPRFRMQKHSRSLRRGNDTVCAIDEPCSEPLVVRSIEPVAQYPTCAV